MRLTQNYSAKLGGSLFVLSGLLVLVNNYAPASGHLNRPLLTNVGVMAIVIGFCSWFLVPWNRASRWATLSLPITALAMIGIANAAGGVSAQSYSAFFILVAAYVGATQPRFTTLALSPAMATVYVGALSYRPDTTPTAVWSVTVVVPVCILVGEVIASAFNRLHSALRRSDRRAQLLAVTAAAAKTVTSLEPRKVLHAVADAAVDLGYDGVAVEVFDRNGAAYRCVESRGLPESFVRGRHPSDSGVTGKVRRERAQVVMRDYDSDARSPSGLRGVGFQVVIGTPIWIGSQMAAVLNVGVKRPLQIEDSELEAIQLLAEQAGRALEQAGDFVRVGRERRRYKRESLLDELTGLGNRRRAEQLIADARAGDAVAILDLDNFKRLNDSLGHGAGDEVLTALGRFLRTALRSGDAAARYGGEEFVLIIRRPGSDLHEAFERLRVAWNASDPLTTFTIGTAVLRKREPAANAVARADAALLRAKAAGKNCIGHSDVVLAVGSQDTVARGPRARRRGIVGPSA